MAPATELARHRLINSEPLQLLQVGPVEQGPRPCDTEWVATQVQHPQSGQSTGLVVNSGNDTTDNIANNGVTVKCGYVQGTSALSTTCDSVRVSRAGQVRPVSQ